MSKKGDWFDDAPTEVKQVWVIQHAGQPIGRVMYDKVQATIEKYPQYFKWEHKYNAIPREVHDAYYDEIVRLNAQIELREMNLRLSKEFEYSPKSSEELLGLFNRLECGRILESNSIKKMNEQKKTIWDKHYSAYGLKYRGD